MEKTIKKQSEEIKKEKSKEKKELRQPDVVSKTSGGWFYTDIVKEHFFKPKNFLDGDEEKSYKADGRGLVGAPACISENTLVHTALTQKPINILTKEDLVLSHDSSHNKITKFLSPKHKGQVIKIKNQLGEIIATPDHLIYAIRIPKTTKYAHNKHKKTLFPSWVHAQDLSKGDIVLYPKENNTYKIKNIKINQERKKYDFNSKTIPNKISLNKDLLRLFGYFIAEGNTRKNGGEITFNFNIKEKEYIEDVKNIMEDIFKLKVKIRNREKNNKSEVVVNSIHLARYLRENFGDGAINKRIPKDFIYLPLDLQAELIKGFWRGDGYISLDTKKPRAEFATISKELTHQIKVLLLRQNIKHSIYKENAKKIKNVNHKECYRIHIGEFDALKNMAALLEVKFNYPLVSRIANHTWLDKNFFYIPIRKITKTQFEGRLFNLEVDKVHSYITDAFSVHNCGDMMSVWIKVDKEKDKILEMKWKTFGCASAIASTSMLSVMVGENGGMPIEKALAIKPQDIIKRLGDLPQRKFHCSVLGDKALRAAINDYFRKSGQKERMTLEGSKIVDKETGITDKDIEEAVLEGADTITKLQHKLKVAVSNKACLPEVEQLMRFYKDKYFGAE